MLENSKMTRDALQSKLNSNTGWKAVCIERMHARFGEGASEKGLRRHLVGVLLYKNIGEAVEDLLARHLSAARKHQVEVTLEAQSPDWLPERTSRRSQTSEALPSAYQQDRMARYQQMIQLHQQGMTQGAIAQQIGVSLNTVRALASQRVS